MVGTHELELLHDITAVQRIDAIPMLLDVVCRSTGMGFAAVSRVTRERWIACSVLDHIKFGLAPGGELPVDSTICDEIRESRVAVIIDHVVEDPDFCDHHTPARYGFQSYISMPIVRKDGQFFGTLCAIDPHPRKLKTPEVVGMFKLFAELIAAHLDNLAAEDVVKNTLADERKTAELREQFIAVVGHDLRNPLSAIQASTQVLRRAPEKMALTLPLIERSAQRMAGLIDNILDFARGRLGGGIALELALNSELRVELEQVVDELRIAWPEREIHTAMDLSYPVLCDKTRIAQVLSNLSANALYHGASDAAVSVAAKSSPDGFSLIVSNAGKPIPQEALADLFQPFFKASSRPSEQGLGLGLFIVSEIVRAHQGTIRAVSERDKTEFIVELPVLSNIS